MNVFELLSVRLAWLAVHCWYWSERLWRLADRVGSWA